MEKFKCMGIDPRTSCYKIGEIHKASDNSLWISSGYTLINLESYVNETENYINATTKH